MLNQFIDKYKSSTFAKNALTLTIGTTIAQILPFAFIQYFQEYIRQNNLVFFIQ